jgi:hypothetical protein
MVYLAFHKCVWRLFSSSTSSIKTGTYKAGAYFDWNNPIKRRA